MLQKQSESAPENPPEDSESSNSSSPNERSQSKCKFWMKGGCRFGNACWYPHDASSKPPCMSQIDPCVIPNNEKAAEPNSFAIPFDQAPFKAFSPKQETLNSPQEFKSPPELKSEAPSRSASDDTLQSDDDRLVQSKDVSSPVYLVSHNNIFGSSCRYWLQSTCNRGLACRFAHPIPNNRNFPIAKFLAAGHGALSKDEQIQLLPHMVSGSPKIYVSEGPQKKAGPNTPQSLNDDLSKIRSPFNTAWDSLTILDDKPFETEWFKEKSVLITPKNQDMQMFYNKDPASFEWNFYQDNLDGLRQRADEYEVEAAKMMRSLCLQ